MPRDSSTISTGHRMTPVSQPIAARGFRIAGQPRTAPAQGQSISGPTSSPVSHTLERRPESHRIAVTRDSVLYWTECCVRPPSAVTVDMPPVRTFRTTTSTYGRAPSLPPSRTPTSGCSPHRLVPLAPPRVAHETADTQTTALRPCVSQHVPTTSHIGHYKYSSQSEAAADRK